MTKMTDSKQLDRCPTCNSPRKDILANYAYYTADGTRCYECPDDWHREPSDPMCGPNKATRDELAKVAVPPEGETKEVMPNEAARQHDRTNQPNRAVTGDAHPSKHAPEGETVREQTVDFPECVDRAAVASPALSAARHKECPGCVSAHDLHDETCRFSRYDPPSIADVDEPPLAEASAPPAGMTAAEPSSCMVCGYIKEKAIYSGSHPEYYVCFDCRDSVQQAAHLRGEVARLTRELEHFEKSGIVEIAVRNPQVAEYCRHWEGRAEQAESELARLREQVRKLIARVEKLPKRFKTNLEWPELVEARAALESTTPPSGKKGGDAQ